MRLLTSAVLLVIVTTMALSQVPLLEENFLYAPGRLVNTLPYSVRATSGTYKQTISSATLNYAGYAGSAIGGSDSLTADGDDYSIDWANFTQSGIAMPATYVNSGSVYLAALVNVQNVTSTADYFLSMHYNNTGSARVYIQQSGADFNFGVSKGGTIPVTYESTARTLGQTYLVVVKYTFNTGTTTDDRIDFWVNPTIDGSEPSATIANFTDGARNDIAAWTGVMIRQGAATAPRVLVDGIRMGTSWATTVAPQYVWTGATSNDFQVSTNWSPNRSTPSVYDVLVFNTGGTVSPSNFPTQSISGLVVDNSTTLTLGTGLTVTGTLTLASGTLSGGGNLTMGNGATIVRADGIISGTPTFGSSTNLTYCGTTAQTTGTECPSTVTNLVLGNNVGTTLSSNLAVDSLLRVGGLMLLNGNTVTLGTSTPRMGSVTFQNSYGGFSGTGTFKRWFPSGVLIEGTTTSRGNNGFFPFATSGLNNRALLISGTPSSGGSVSVSYNDATSVSAISFSENSTTFVNRLDANWNVVVADGLAGTMTLAINGAGIPGINATADLNVSGSSGAAPGTFSATTGTTAAPVVNRTGLTETTLPTTYYIASAAGSPLPVEMTSFTAFSERLTTTLQWSTTTEVSSLGFEIQRRLAGQLSWENIGFVEGAGTSTTKHDYTYVDKVASAGRYAYRIKQLDTEGSFKYSQATEIEVGSVAKILQLDSNYPNPFNPTTSIEFTVPANGKAVLKVFNVLGQHVATPFDGDVAAGMLTKATFDASRLPSGTYFSVLEYNGQSIVKRMTLMK